MREGRDRGRGRGGRKKGKHFMDAVTDGYIRDMALEKWREIDDMVDTLGMKLGEAVVEAGGFSARGPYRELWQKWWRREVREQGELEPDMLMERIEAAVRGALNEEVARRASEGEPTIEDTPHYTAFVARAMETLLEDGEGEIEDFDEDEL